MSSGSIAGDPMCCLLGVRRRSCPVRRGSDPGDPGDGGPWWRCGRPDPTAVGVGHLLSPPAHRVRSGADPEQPHRWVHPGGDAEENAGPRWVDAARGTGPLADLGHVGQRPDVYVVEMARPTSRAVVFSVVIAMACGVSGTWIPGVGQGDRRPMISVRSASRSYPGPIAAHGSATLAVDAWRTARPGTFGAGDQHAVGTTVLPSISGITPASGPRSGGTLVTITGSGFLAGATVEFGLAGAASVTVVDSTTIVAESPPAYSFPVVYVSVTTSAGTSPLVASARFTYLGTGYDLVGSDGGVFVFGGGFFQQGFYGSLPGLGIHVGNITGIVPTTADTGYFLVGSDGGVFAFNAAFANSLPGIGVHVDDIVGIVPTLDDQGYFLVGRDGGVFCLNAPFVNSLPGMGIHVDDIVGIAHTSDDGGYWLVGSDGTVYAIGDAHSFGNAPTGAVGISATLDGGGYWIVGADGTVTAFGDANGFGDLPSDGVAVNNIVGIVVSADSMGYSLIGSDGGVFSFGDAQNKGSLPGLGVSVDNIVGAAAA